MNKILDIPDHPFFIGPVEGSTGEKYNLPRSLPFALGVDERYAIPRLVMTDDIVNALDKAYAAGSMASTPLGESRLATDRMNEMIEKLISLYDGNIEGKKLLEIGCGNGELLHQLKLRGAVVTGLEIGPQAEIVEKRYGIPVIREVLKKDCLNEQFDCIFSYGCLEHIEQLENFFDASRSCLADNGLFFHSVPNSALSFDTLQADHLLHEHINYFTPENGERLLNAQGFRSARSCLTKNKNELMLWGYYDRSAVLSWPAHYADSETEMLKKYASGLGDKFASILKAVQTQVNSGRSVGFYAGGFEYGFYIQDRGIRYFDGDEFKHGKKWLLDLPVIEAPHDLASNPVDLLIVCKPHYFDPISKALTSVGFNHDRIANIEQIAGPERQV